MREQNAAFTATEAPEGLRPGQLAGIEASPAAETRQGAGELAGRETAASASEASEKIMDSVSDPEFSLAVEVAYHDARQFFFEAAHRWAMFLTIVLGASAVAPFGEKPLALLAAVVAAADIAFDLTGRAQRHADFRRRYYELVADVAERGAEAAEFSKRWMLISADEPPLYRWVEKIAWRNVCIAMEREIPDPLPWSKRLTAHFLRG